MTEFTAAEQMQLTAGMTEEERFTFQVRYGTERRDRNLMLVISIFLGYLGVDRFLVGDIGLGLLKFFTGGLFGVLWILDIFLIRGRVDEENRQKAIRIATSVRTGVPVL